MSILIQKAGILTTVQDLGRRGFRRFGINPGGVMDARAARLINILLGNDENETVLEIHFPAAEIRFEKPCIFAVGGAEMTPNLDGKNIDNWRVYNAKRGDVLKFSQKKLGNRTYLAIRGGFAIDKWLGSSSTNLTAAIGGFEGRKLKNSDCLNLRQPEQTAYRPRFPQKISPSLIPHYSSFPTVRVIAGAEFERLDGDSKKKFENTGFTVTNDSNRMGFRLNGEDLALKTPIEIVSSAVSFGTIQLLPDGQMIALMADHQTSGGYPRIAHVIDHDLPVIAQLGSRDQVAFHMISLAEAEYLSLTVEKEIAFLKTGVRFASDQY